MLGFFAENRPEYVISEIACLSDSIVTVLIPIKAVEQSPLEAVLTDLELPTLCVSKHTLSFILKIKQAGGLKYLKNVICFDTLNPRTDKELFEEVKYQRCVGFYTY